TVSPVGRHWAREHCRARAGAGWAGRPPRHRQGVGRPRGDLVISLGGVYIPSRFREDDREWQLEFMRRHGFAVVVSVSEGRPAATHLPLTVKVAGEEVFLRGHFAKANPQWRGLEDGEVLAVFNGPHAYVSPRHYDAFESVPTWNYLTVHA